MGSPASKLIQEERALWEGVHELKIDQTLRKTQEKHVSDLKSPVKICYVQTQARGVEFEHWYITDGFYIVEFGDLALQECIFRIFASPPRNGQIVEKEFALTIDVKRRLQQVCGATNYSLALRNSEHMARFIHSGTWMSSQMVGTAAMMKTFEKELRPFRTLLNTCPTDLVTPVRTSGGPVFPGLRTCFDVRYTDKRPCLDTQPNKSINVVFLGPTGSGKSSIINLLFNSYVAEVKASPMSVTKQMEVYCGSFTDVTGANLPLNLIDSVGFCDSVLKPQVVLQLVKSYIKANMLKIHKVVIVCSSRIEREHSEAISNFMKWLKYQKHKSEFVFIYNKAEHLQEGDRLQAVAEMCDMLGADPRHSAHYEIDEHETREIKYAIAVGCPPRSNLEVVQGDLNALYDAVFHFRGDQRGISVSESDCPIL